MSAHLHFSFLPIFNSWPALSQVILRCPAKINGDIFHNSICFGTSASAFVRKVTWRQFYWPCFIFWSRKIASFYLSLIFLFTGENAKWQLCGPVQLFTSRELTNGACGKSVATIGASQQFPSFKNTSKQAWNLKTRNQRKLCHFVQQVC